MLLFLSFAVKRLWYLIWMDIFAPFVFLIIYSIFQCHTVVLASEHSSLPSFQDESSVKSVTRALFKRENDSNIDQPQNISALDNKTIAVDLLNNRTISAVKRPTTNGELNVPHSSPAWMDTINSGALQRTGFVALGFMSIIVIFFVVRGIRLRHKKSKSRKYGIITSTDMEMEPLDKDDDDEEETTLFDAQHKYSLQ